MKKMKKLIVGNWKMNPVSVAEAKKLASDIKKGVLGIKRTEAIMSVPFVYLGSLSFVPSATIMLGAQNAHPEPFGAYTGEVSFSQLLDFKVSAVIVGHSERRKNGETDEMVNKKVRAVIGEGMTAVICIGEEVRDHNGEYLAHLKMQLTSALKDVSKRNMDHLVIAYEPIWAIGAKYAMTTRDIHETAIYIRKCLKELYGIAADDVRILYGGAVDTTNAQEIVREGNVGGLLIGRESLKAKNFVQIVKDIEAIK